LVTTDFRPQAGGIATLFADLARACSGKCEVTVWAPAMAGAAEFDRIQPYRVTRVPGPPLRRELAIARRLADPRQAVDLVVCASWFPSGLAGSLLRRARRVPYLVWAHGSEVVDDWRNPRRVVKWSLRPLKRWIFDRSAGVVANSRYTANLVVAHGVRPALVRVVLPGVDARRFTPGSPSAEARARYRGEARHCLLTVARLDPNKGHAAVLQALATELRDVPGIRYLVAGTGPEAGALRRLTAALGLESRVCFLGAVGEAELPDVYRAADVFVMPSRELPGRRDYIEGFGIAYLEAAATAKPVIGGRSGGVEDAVAHGVTGLLVRPDDPVEVARAIRTLLEDGALAERLGRAGRERVVADFSLEALAERFLSVARGAVLGDIA
jgi:phosphatidylinositol alpha-1,6-mannosyltransferase